MFRKYLFLIVPVLAAFFCSLLFFTSLDGQIFDRLLRTIPSLGEDDRILIIKVDDGSIENVGLFPWTRDILADAIVFLREMGADTVVFDLSYLDNSPGGVDSAYVREDLPRYLDNGFIRINDTVSQVMDAFAEGSLGRGDAESAKHEIVALNNSVKNELAVSIDYVTRDVDAYFADALQFFGKSYLTITMVSEDDILGDDKTYDMNPVIQNWLENHIALKDIVNRGDTLTPDEPGIIPSIFKLISRAGGAGFVNAEPDRDGYRRRVHLLLKHHGHYYPHLALAALRETLGNPAVEVSNSAITLKNALVNDNVRDIRIPRTEDGSVLVKWPKKTFADYNAMSSWELIRYNRIEADLAQNLRLMADSNMFAYWDGGETPLETYRNANYIRELLYQGEDNDEGVTFDTYLEFRARYLKTADAFLNGPYEEYIKADIDSGDEETRWWLTELFAVSRDQFGQLLEIRERVRAKTAGTVSIIGVDATSMTDLGLTTFQEQFPNVGIYSAISNMILSGEFLDDAPRPVSFLIALLLSLALGLIIKRLDVGRSVFAGIIALAVTAAALTVFFMITKRYVGMAVPFVSAALTFLTLTGINFFTTLREKSFLRSAFSRYLAPQVVEQIIADPSKLNLGGEKREMTAIFTDIRGFSTISEQLDPADLVNLLNLYLTEMSNIVLENRGTIDKYEGDAIIAFFGAPIYMEEHAVLACKTAIGMKKAEIRMNEKIITEKISPGPVFTRIGINTGDMVVGNMGTPSKMDYTIMGNAVNLAARLEGVNKQYHTGGILISEYTRTQIGEEFILRGLDRVRVVGINTPLRLYELLETREAAAPALLEKTALWEKAVELYEGRNFADAAGGFRTIAGKDPGDLTARLYLERCETFLKNPPPPEWDGVNNLTQK
ncbi:MAG: CHASE2 domain-containing protein [Treponema sp.]|jgi:adenylate cyclase|nr:CHASE2 domain-containing protein [Treponema sp.]